MDNSIKQVQYSNPNMILYFKNWFNILLEELSRTSKFRVISPFINEQTIRIIQKEFDFHNFEIITRFSLHDFASNVSSLDGLKFSVKKGAAIYGIKGLHSKIFLFDSRAAIITSANLTMGGLVTNYECGIYLKDRKIIKDLHNYFEKLKGLAKNKLTLRNCIDWQQELKKSVEKSNRKYPLFQDYGSPSVHVDEKKNYYIKLFGTSKDRVPLSFKTRDEIDEALCHYACGFSRYKKPRQINDGDIIYMARMTFNPRDYAIFGKAEAIRYVEGRDTATVLEIQERPWKAQWPIYLRLQNPTFIDGTMADCVLLYDLIKNLDYASFPSTQERYDRGEKNINVKRSLSQQSYVKLSLKSIEWLETKFQESLARTGTVDDKFIMDLPQTYTDIANWRR